MLLNSIGIGILIFFAWVIYWFLKTIPQPSPDQKRKDLSHDLKFETAPEIMAYPSETMEDSQEYNIKLFMVDQACMACWSLEGSILGGKQPEDLENELILRIYEAGDMLRHHDIKTNKLKGSCRLYLRKDRAYYVSLGLKHGASFHPLLVSNTLIPYSVQ